MLAVMQPTLFPWLGYFDLIDQSDTFVLYNDVQFSKQSWQTRNRIPTANGVLLISIPTLKCDLHSNIEQVYLDTTKDWNKKLLKTLQLTYQKSAYFSEVFPWLTSFLQKEFTLLQDFNSTFIKEVSAKIGIDTTFTFSSDLSIISSDRVDRLIELSTMHQAHAYLSTTGSYGYLNDEHAHERFAKQGIKLLFHHYKPIEYNTGKNGFEPYMSIIDALFHCGFSNCLSVIRAGRHENYTFEEYKKLQHD